MLLKKLSVFGFKSFADKTELTFGEGFTGVIGPNGCGKSNVVDAVRWVLGEQKTTLLRSGNMQDVIFSGTQDRHPLNIAEVSLTILNNQGILPVEYGEVEVTRRLYRSGESEYMINRAPCRLKDIHNLFMDTGTGSNSYTTIENNMIDRILSDRTEERRILFEEAAGIGKYKRRIKESERKLERTNQDLLRINDRIQEKDRYVRMLGRQVEKAKRYRRYKDDLYNLEVGMENYRFKELSNKIREINENSSEYDKKLSDIEKEISVDDLEIENMETMKIEKENELQVASRNVSDVSEEIHEIDRNISMSDQQVGFERDNTERFKHEAESFEEQIKEKRDLVKRIEEGLIQREKNLVEQSEKVENKRNELEDFDKRISNHKEALNEVVDAHLSIIHSIGDRQKELNTTQMNLTNNLGRKEETERELGYQNRRLEEYYEALKNCKTKLSEESDAYRNFSGSREALWKRVEEEENRYHKLLEQEKSLEAGIDSAKSQLHFLEGLDSSYEGYKGGVKALLQQDIKGVEGMLADMITVNDQDAVRAIEKVCAEAIQTVVFKNGDDLKNAVDYLQNNKHGSARVIALDKLGETEIVEAEGNLKTVKPLRTYINSKDDYSQLIDAVFGRILMCDSEQELFIYPLSGENAEILVSRSGIIRYSDGTLVAGAKKQEAGILQRKQDIERLNREIVERHREYEKVIGNKDICVINRDEAKHALVEVDEKLNIKRQKQQECETDMKHYEQGIEEINAKTSNLESLLTQVEAEIIELEKSKNSLEDECKQVLECKAEIEEHNSTAKVRLGRMEEERKEIADKLKNFELGMHGLKNRTDQDRNSSIQLKSDIERYLYEKRKKIEGINKAGENINNLRNRLEYLKNSVNEKKVQREELVRILDEKREEYNGILSIIEEKRKAQKIKRKDMNILSEELHKLRLEQTRNEEKKRSIREKIYNAHEVDLESAPDDTPCIESFDEEVMDNIHKLKERLKRVGEVNMGAPEEYEKENEDLLYLISQRDDLQSASDDLQGAIKKLNKKARLQFKETFELVQKEFVNVFTTLFDGGEAKLTLQDDTNPLESPININVRPPGKKMRGVTLLSGGERALTAISLLFALYRIKPSAYCILDELDAALDDANIGRFIRMLRKFSEKTQFLVITHNKQTMEAADVLYGVTQQEKGVSVIASVKVEERVLKAA